MTLCAMRASAFASAEYETALRAGPAPGLLLLALLSNGAYRKWRKAHPEKNRAIRRQQYQRSKAAELRLSKHASIKIAKPRQRSPK